MAVKNSKRVKITEWTLSQTYDVQACFVRFCYFNGG